MAERDREYKALISSIAGEYAPCISNPDLAELAREFLPSAVRVSGSKEQKLSIILSNVAPELMQYLIARLQTTVTGIAQREKVQDSTLRLLSLAAHSPRLPRDQTSDDVNNKVFISHGHNEVVWRRLYSFIKEELALQPVVMEEEPGVGRLLLEKFAHLARQCTFALVLLTGDDEVDAKHRPRQNVIYEVGFFHALLGLDRAMLLAQQDIEIPSQLQGVVYHPFAGNEIGLAFEGIRKELRHVGIAAA